MTSRGNPRYGQQRLVGLDLLRLLAIILVLGRHMELPPETWPAVSQNALSAWHRGGWIGVDLFFVLSGFLVSGLLFSEYRAFGRLYWWRFFIRRGWKIYPPFYVLLTATLVLNAIFWKPKAIRQVTGELFFLQNYLGSIWNHTWSLAVEEHFYLLLPAVLFLLIRWRKSAENPFTIVPWIASGIAIACLTMRILNAYLRNSYSNHTHLFPTHLRLDSLFLGVALGYAYHFRREQFESVGRRWKHLLLVVGLLAFVPAFVFTLESSPSIYTVGLTLFAVGSGCLIVGTLASQIPRSPFITLAASIGAYSYSIYLWHMPLREWGIPAMQHLLGIELSYAGRCILYLAGALVLGIVMARAIEIPTLQVRDRWFPAMNRPAKLPASSSITAITLASK